MKSLDEWSVKTSTRVSQVLLESMYSREGTQQPQFDE